MRDLDLFLKKFIDLIASSTSFNLAFANFSGVGNWIRAEILYECKIAPNRKLKDLSESDIKHLYHWSIKILKDAYNVKGLTISNYIDPEGNYGTYKVKVYMQKKDPYGHKVITSVFSDKRTIHWVPEVQI